MKLTPHAFHGIDLYEFARAVWPVALRVAGAGWRPLPNLCFPRRLSGGGLGFYHCGNVVVALDPETWLPQPAETMGTVVHELAHAVLGRRDRGHGPLFGQTLREMAAILFGQERLDCVYTFAQRVPAASGRFVLTYRVGGVSLDSQVVGAINDWLACGGRVEDLTP